MIVPPAYRLIGAYSPASIFPGIVLPVFSDEQIPKNYYLQVLDEQGKVARFRRVSNRYNRIIFYEDQMLFSWIGEGAVFGYAVSEGSIFFSERASDFKTRISQLEKDGLYARSPLSGVEVARYLGQPDAECKYAELAAVTIATISRDVADIWIEKGVLSSEARTSARIALASGYELPDFAASNKVARIIEQTRTFARKYMVTERTDGDVVLVTGSGYRKSNKIGVFHIDALLMDAEDVADVNDGASTEYARLIASGKCSHAYILIPGEGKTALKYLRDKGVKVIPSQDSGTPEWLIAGLFDHFYRGLS